RGQRRPPGVRQAPRCSDTPLLRGPRTGRASSDPPPRPRRPPVRPWPSAPLLTPPGRRPSHGRPKVDGQAISSNAKGPKGPTVRPLTSHVTSVCVAQAGGSWRVAYLVSYSFLKK